MSPTPFPGLLHVRCTQVLSPAVPPARLLLLFFPSPRTGRPLQACCALSGEVPCPASYPSRPPGDEDTNQLLTVQSSDQSRVLNSSKPNFSASALLLLEGMCCGELLETLIRLLQKLLFLKIDPVFVALILHSYRCTSPGGRRGCRNPWCFTTLLW